MLWAQVAKHDEKPRKVTEPPFDSGEMATRLLGTPYGQKLQKLRESVRGKVVESSLIGTSGYALAFTDGSWLAIFVDPTNQNLNFKEGNGALEATRSLFEHPDVVHGSAPQAVVAPYADEPCDLPAEVTKAHGQCVRTVAFGENDFNLVFPGGMELENHVLRLKDGRFTLRVFWEQW